LPLVALRMREFPGWIPATYGSDRRKTERQLALCVAQPLASDEELDFGCQGGDFRGSKSSSALALCGSERQIAVLF
ncbi:MAG: hypothetical protein QF805_28720, partial [Pirellulaceae bacterium]|nr:hypothetical protein [Pirellulaceae bacterium]